MLQKRYKFKDDMTLLETRLTEKVCEISDLYADAMLNEGPMQVACTKCFTGYLHSFHIRGILAHWREFENDEWFDAAREWAAWSIRMQGTYGDEAAYNMGYLFSTRHGTPNDWFVADTLDQAFALLNVAYYLDPYDSLYSQILESVLKYDKYVQKWYLGKRGFALGYLGGKLLDQEPYHTATTRGICYYAAMYRIFNKEEFRSKGLELLQAYQDAKDTDSNFHGSPLHNRCYASDALLNAYYVLGGGDDALRQEILDIVRTKVIAWAIRHQETAGYWVHDRFESDPGAARPLDKSVVGPYSWGLLLGMRVFSDVLNDDPALAESMNRAYCYLAENIIPGDINLWGGHCWATVAIAGMLYPQNLFPFGEYLNKE